MNEIFQSKNEMRFLDFWLRFNAGKETPIPIPQVYVEPLQERRADFVIFIRIKNEWEWYVIEIDSPTFHRNKDKELERNNFFKKQGYDVIHISTRKMMINQVRDLYSKLILSHS